MIIDRDFDLLVRLDTVWVKVKGQGHRMNFHGNINETY